MLQISLSEVYGSKLRGIKMLETCEALTAFKERRANGLKSLDEATQGAATSDLNREVEVSIGHGNMQVSSKSEQNPYCVKVSWVK